MTWSHGQPAVPSTPGGGGMDFSFVQVAPPSSENSRSASLFQANVKRVIAIWSGLAGLMARAGSLPPVLFAAAVASITDTPAANGLSLVAARPACPRKIVRSGGLLLTAAFDGE